MTIHRTRYKQAIRAEILLSISAAEPHRTKEHVTEPKGIIMLWTIFVILLVLWLLGLVSSYTLGGFIHILLVIAIVVLIIQFDPRPPLIVSSHQ